MTKVNKEVSTKKVKWTKEELEDLYLFATELGVSWSGITDLYIEDFSYLEDNPYRDDTLTLKGRGPGNEAFIFRVKINHDIDLRETSTERDPSSIHGWKTHKVTKLGAFPVRNHWITMDGVTVTADEVGYLVKEETPPVWARQHYMDAQWLAKPDNSLDWS